MASSEVRPLVKLVLQRDKKSSLAKGKGNLLWSQVSVSQAYCGK